MSSQYQPLSEGEYKSYRSPLEINWEEVEATPNHVIIVYPATFGIDITPKPARLTTRRIKGYYKYKTDYLTRERVMERLNMWVEFFPDLANGTTYGFRFKHKFFIVQTEKGYLWCDDKFESWPTEVLEQLICKPM